MTVEELRGKLEAVNSRLTGSDFGAIDDGIIAELSGLEPEAESLGMKSGKQLLENLASVLKNRKEGKTSDESVTLRLTALDFYIKKIQSGDTEDL